MYFVKRKPLDLASVDSDSYKCKRCLIWSACKCLLICSLACDPHANLVSSALQGGDRGNITVSDAEYSEGRASCIQMFFHLDLPFL